MRHSTAGQAGGSLPASPPVRARFCARRHALRHYLAAFRTERAAWRPDGARYRPAVVPWRMSVAMDGQVTASGGVTADRCVFRSAVAHADDRAGVSATR